MSIYEGVDPAPSLPDFEKGDLIVIDETAAGGRVSHVIVTDSVTWDEGRSGHITVMTDPFEDDEPQA